MDEGLNSDAGITPGGSGLDAISTAEAIVLYIIQQYNNKHISRM
jgi:hypothetical protein